MQNAKLISYCRTLPNATWENKWRGTLVFMVQKKMFALFVLDERERPTELWCKVDDDQFLSYTGQPGIRPAPYLARARDIVFMKLPKRTQQELLAQQN